MPVIPYQVNKELNGAHSLREWVETWE